MHNPSDGPIEAPDEATAARNSRVGLVFFFVYLAFYGGFVVLSAFAPARMEQVVWGGLNLAVVCGFALILAAFCLALLYGFWVRNPVSADRPGGGPHSGRGGG